ncbi:MAG: class II aldolase/adducin family protein [Candidatus Omnitrophica bacterium]|nr:class II aldolase/adducin family protein [Candidatus Omnitrophota bacterium]
MKFIKEKEEIIKWGQLLNQRQLLTAKNGNLSFRVEDQQLLITAHDSYLGFLEKDEILLCDLEGRLLESDKQITTESNLHLGIYKRYPDVKVVLHAHSPATTAFFSLFNALKSFSFETKFYLSGLSIIPQSAPTVIDVIPVIEALSESKIVVLKNHGVVAVGASFKEAFGLLELLEEQAKINFMVKADKLGA